MRAEWSYLYWGVPHTYKPHLITTLNVVDSVVLHLCPCSYISSSDTEQWRCKALSQRILCGSVPPSGCIWELHWWPRWRGLPLHIEGHGFAEYAVSLCEAGNWWSRSVSWPWSVLRTSPVKMSPVPSSVKMFGSWPWIAATFTGLDRPVRRI